jgi:hypothetical protein
VLVGIAAGFAVGSVCAHGIEHGVALRPGFHVCLNVESVDLPCGVVAVKAVREPVVHAIEEDDDGGKGRTLGHVLGVVVDSIEVNLGPRLRPPVNPD